MLLLGLVSGLAVLDLLPEFTQEWFPVVADTALVMIGACISENARSR